MRHPQMPFIFDFCYMHRSLDPHQKTKTCYVLIWHDFENNLNLYPFLLILFKITKPFCPKLHDCIWQVWILTLVLKNILILLSRIYKKKIPARANIPLETWDSFSHLFVCVFWNFLCFCVSCLWGILVGKITHVNEKKKGLGSRATKSNLQRD